MQNLTLAPTALRFATRLITAHRIFESEVKALLGIADDIETLALIPLGRPASSSAGRDFRSHPAFGDVL